MQFVKDFFYQSDHETFSIRKKIFPNESLKDPGRRLFQALSGYHIFASVNQSRVVSH